MNDAVLIMAHGGPRNEAEIPAFLAHIRQGRPVSEQFVAEVIARYRLIGGRSPLADISQRLQDKLKQKTQLPVYLAMKHTAPFIEDEVERMHQEGVRVATAICLAPHYSHMSVGKYEKTLQKASAGRIDFRFVPTWHLTEGYLDFLQTRIERALAGQDPQHTQLWLTAHSLPQSILAAQDPYVDQLNATSCALRQRLGLTANQAPLVFQSASPSGEPWLTPSLEDQLELAFSQGLKNIVVAPIGFVAEHVEILYDLDIVLKQDAAQKGINITRIDMLNDTDEMVEILARLVAP